MGAEALAGALSTVETIMTLNVIGALMAMYPKPPPGTEPTDSATGTETDPIGARGILTQPTIKSMSRLGVSIFLPCLVASKLAKGLTLVKFMAAWPMPLCCWAQIGTACAIGLVVRRLVNPPKHLWRPFLCAITFQNSSALPLVIVQSLSGFPPFDRVDDAFDQMALYVFVYNVGWQFCFWCLGYPYLIGGGSQGSGAGDRGRDVSAMVRKGLSSPVLISSFVGVAIGLVTPLQTALFANGAPLRFLGSAVEILGQAAVPMVTCVISGTLGKSILRSWQPKRTMSPDPAAAPAGKSAGENGASIAVDDSTAVLMETSLPHHLPRKRLDTYHAHGGGTDSGEAHATEEEVPFQMLVILCFVRVVVVAGIQFWGISLLLPSLPKGTELMQLVVLIECCVPSANMIIVCCQQYGQRRAAEDLSKAYVMMFAASFASMVFFVSRALALTVEKNMDWADGQHL